MRRDSPAGPNGRDCLLVGALVIAALVEGFARVELPDRWAAIGLTAALTATLFWRRVRPLAMLVVAFGAVALVPLVAPGHDLATHTSAFMLILIYAVFRWGSYREWAIAAAVLVAKLLQSWAVDRLTLPDLFGGFVVVLVAGVLGAAMSLRARERERQLDQVRLREREHLARDLHDTVAHHVSAIAIRAQAGLAVSTVDPSAAADSLRVIEAEAVRALAEMRALVRILRHDDPAELAPLPGLDDLARLADVHVGPRVTVRVEGEAGGVATAVGAAVYQLAQESVTNARRHARQATSIEVSAVVTGDEVRLRVRDDGAVSGQTRRGAGEGYGIRGMKERAHLLGGTCEAGPAPDQGWLVTATLPRTAP